MKNEFKLENENFPEKTEAELELDLESILSHESIFKFVNLHYMNDLGNDTPPSSAEMEEAFRSFVFSLGFKGPKVESFIQRAMSSIDDYDYTDKFDNLDQIKNANYGNKLFGLDSYSNISDFKIDQKNESNNELSNSHKFRNKHKNNPFYIDPFNIKKLI